MKPRNFIVTTRGDIPPCGLLKQFAFVRLYVLLLFLIVGLPSYAQTSSPSVGIWKTYSAPYVCTNGSLNGTAFNLSNGAGSIPDTAVKGRVTALSSSHITIEIEKQTGTTYFQNGEAWGASNVNNPNGLCGSIKNDYQTIASNPTKITLNFAHGITAGGNGYFYAVYRNSITGKYYYVGNFYITIPIVPASLSGSITGISGLWQHNKPSYITSQVNTNNGSFNGNVRMGWYDGTGNYITYLLDSPINNLPNGQSKNINFTTNSITSKAGNYIAKLEYRPTGATTYTLLDSRNISITPEINCSSINVPFSKQSNGVQCGQNCVRMCLMYFDNISSGFPIQDVCDAMGENGISDASQQVKGFNNLTNSKFSAHASILTLEQLNAHLCNNKPVMIWVRVNMSSKLSSIGHAMVAVGRDDDNIFVNDPQYAGGKNMTYSIQDFVNSWQTQNNWAVIFNERVGGTFVNEQKMLHSVNAYPNPTTGIVSIKIPSNVTTKKMLLNIRNMMGAIVVREILDSDTINVNLSNFPDGIYAIQLVDDKNVVISSDKILLKK